MVSYEAYDGKQYDTGIQLIVRSLLRKRPLGIHKLLSGRNETSEFSVDDYFPLMLAYKLELEIPVYCRLCTLLA